MQTSKTFTDERSGYAAVAAEAVANCGVFVGDALTAWNSVELPDASTFADPALFAVGGCDEHSSLLATVVYAQRPFGLELVDVFVGNGDLTERVYDHEVVFSQHELGSNPHEQRTHGNGCCKAELDPVHRVFNRIENYLSQEQGIENQSNNRPGEVAFGPENEVFIHASIIAGIAAVQEGK